MSFCRGVPSLGDLDNDTSSIQNRVLRDSTERTGTASVTGGGRVSAQGALDFAYQHLESLYPWEDIASIKRQLSKLEDTDLQVLIDNPKMQESLEIQAMHHSGIVQSYARAILADRRRKFDARTKIMIAGVALLGVIIGSLTGALFG